MFEQIFVPTPFREALSDRAWLQAMLDVERALATAEATAGVVPADAAAAIAEACRAERFDAVALGEAGRSPGNPVEPLVRALRSVVGDEAADYVHWGATSQDILDTAAMLVSRRAVDLLVQTLDAVAGKCAELADSHRSTLLAARTLLQQAVPTTFGLKAAGWLVGVLEARSALVRVRDTRAVRPTGHDSPRSATPARRSCGAWQRSSACGSRLLRGTRIACASRSWAQLSGSRPALSRRSPSTSAS